jgi:hypothetical protein
MANQIRVCEICDKSFELLPDKPGLINQCPECVAPKSADPKAVRHANLVRTLEAIGKTIRWHENEIERIRKSGRISGIAYQEEQIEKFLMTKRTKEQLLGAPWES